MMFSVLLASAFGLQYDRDTFRDGQCATLLEVNVRYATSSEALAACEAANEQEEGSCMAAQRNAAPPYCKRDYNEDKVECTKRYQLCSGAEAQGAQVIGNKVINMKDGARSVDDEDTEDLINSLEQLVGDMEDEAPGARLAGYEQFCRQDSDCQSNRCYTPRNGNGWCDNARSARKAGYEEFCRQDSDCQSNRCYTPRRGNGWCDNARGARLAGYEEFCRKDSDCQSNRCYTPRNGNGWCDSARSARLAGYEQYCRADSDCQSNRCYTPRRGNGWCDRARGARGIDSEDRQARAYWTQCYNDCRAGTGNFAGKGPGKSGTCSFTCM